MTQRPPGEHVDQREPRGVVGVGEEGHFLGVAVTSIKVSLAILLGKAGFGKRCAVVGEEDETAQRQRGNGAPTDNEVGVGEGLGGEAGGTGSRGSGAAHLQCVK